LPTEKKIHSAPGNEQPPHGTRWELSQIYMYFFFPLHGVYPSSK
jgi:hypothetical protein